MIPLIFAFSIVILPGSMATYFATTTGVVGDVARFFADLLIPTSPPYWIMVFILVVFRIGIKVSGESMKRPFGIILLSSYARVTVMSYLIQP